MSDAIWKIYVGTSAAAVHPKEWLLFKSDSTCFRHLEVSDFSMYNNNYTKSKLAKSWVRYLECASLTLRRWYPDRWYCSRDLQCHLLCQKCLFAIFCCTIVQGTFLIAKKHSTSMVGIARIRWLLQLSASEQNSLQNRVYTWDINNQASCCFWIFSSSDNTTRSQNTEHRLQKQV